MAGHRHLPLVLVAIVGLGRALSELQKYWVARVRPDLEPHLVVVKTSSFPSGHAASSMIFYLTLALALTAQDALAAAGRGRRDPAVAADRHQPGDARRALAERRDRRLGVRAAVGAAYAAARAAPVSGLRCRA